MQCLQYGTPWPTYWQPWLPGRSSRVTNPTLCRQLSPRGQWHSCSGGHVHVKPTCPLQAMQCAVSPGRPVGVLCSWTAQQAVPAAGPRWPPGRLVGQQRVLRLPHTQQQPPPGVAHESRHLYGTAGSASRVNHLFRYCQHASAHNLETAALQV